MMQGVIFDLDGTLVDSRLDFDQMRREMQLEAGRPILEALEQMDPARAEQCRRILLDHELRGAERSEPLPGVAALLDWLAARRLPAAVVTRNSRPIAARMLADLPFAFDPVLTRDDGPVKPDPWAVRQVCRQWRAAPERVLVVGDYHFDLQAARAAGCPCLIVLGRRDPSEHGWAAQADLLLQTLDPTGPVVRWIEERLG